MTTQLTLEFEPGLTERYRSLRECLVACVYSHGLSNVADDLAKAPGNLARELAGDSDRHFSIEALEVYIQKQGDLTPIYYLIARYLGDQAAAESATLRRVEGLLAEVAALVGQTQPKKSRGR